MAVTYTRLARPPQTAWARHLDAVRIERDWSGTQMFEDAREALGLRPKSRTAFMSLLIDDEPNERQAKALAELYGAPQPGTEAEPQPAPDAATLAAILDRQVAINELLVARLDAADRRADALEALVATLSAPTLADPTALEAMRAWGRDALDRSRTRVQRPETLRVTE